MTEHETLVFQGTEVKALGDGRIGGYLVLFSGPTDPDLTGDFFTKDTNFGNRKGTDILFHHGMDSILKDRVLGQGEWKVDDVGVWVEGILDERDQYEKAILRLAQEGKLGWSSGTASHLVTREQKGNAYWIKSWPLGLDASLTHTPAEPRTKAVALKADGYQNLLNAISEAQPEAEQVAPVAASVGAEQGTVNQEQSTPTLKMENENTPQEAEVKTAPEPKPGYAKVPAGEAKATSLITLSKEEYDALKSVQTAPEQVTPAVKNVVEIPGAPNLNLKTERGDSEMKAFTHFLRTGTKANVDMQVGTDAEGGYLAPALHYETIIERRNEVSIPRLAGVQTFSGSHKSIEVPVQASDAVATTLTAEEATETRDSPVIGQVVITAYKYTQSITVSNELLQDHKSNLLEVIQRYVANGMAVRENTNFLVGTGSSQPQGIYVGGTAAFTAVGAAALTPAEIVDLMYDLPGEYAENAAWFMHRGTEGYVRGLTGDAFQFDITPGGTGNAGQNGGRLLGAPVFTSSANATLATGNKSVCVGNPQYYGLYDRVQLEVLRNPFLKAATNQTVFHYSYRQGGAVLQGGAFQYITQA